MPASVQVIDFGICRAGPDVRLARWRRRSDTCGCGYSQWRAGTLDVLEVKPPEHMRPETAGVTSDFAFEMHNLDPVHVVQLAAAMGSSVSQSLVVGCEPAPLGNLEDEAAELSAPVRAADGEATIASESLVRRFSRHLVNPNGSVEDPSCRM